MSPFLPPEIVELIVKEASRSKGAAQALNALSLVNKAFTAACQLRLWHSVTFHSAVAISSTIHRKSQALAWKIVCCPNIGAYVTRLTCHIVSGCNVPDHDTLAGAFRAMPNVAEFTLKYGKKGSNRCMEFEGSRNARYTAIHNVLTSANLRHLSLRRISGIPVRSFKQAVANLESLDLYMCSFTSEGPQTASAGIADEAGMPPTLGKLTCDLGSYQHLHRLLHPPQRKEDLAFDFSGITTLELAVDGAIGSEHGILGQAANLRDFRLHILKPSLRDSLVGATLLRQVNPASQTAITRLWVSIQHQHILPIVSEPFMGLCANEALPMLLSLQTFELDMHFNVPVCGRNWEDGILKWRHPRNSAWDQLDKVLSSLVELTKLRVRVYLKHMAEREGQAKRRDRLTAERIREHILENIYPVQFPRLCSSSDAGEVNFEFTTNLARS